MSPQPVCCREITRACRPSSNTSVSSLMRRTSCLPSFRLRDAQRKRIGRPVLGFRKDSKLRARRSNDVGRLNGIAARAEIVIRLHVIQRWSWAMRTNTALSFEGIHSSLQTLFGADLHAKRVLSLVGATLGVIQSASLAVAMTGQG